MGNSTQWRSWQFCTLPVGMVGKERSDDSCLNSLVSWFGECRWSLQAQLAQRRVVALSMASVCATLVYQLTYFYRFPMLVPIDSCKTAVYDQKACHELPGCAWFERHGHRPAGCRNKGHRSADHDIYGEWLGHRGKVWLIFGFAVGYVLGKLVSAGLVPSLLPRRRLLAVGSILAVIFAVGAAPFQFLGLAGRMSIVTAAAMPCAAVFGAMAQYLEGREATEMP